MYTGIIPRNNQNEVTLPVSSYNPSEKERQRLALVMREFTYCKSLQNKTFREFNDRTLITEIDLSHKAFNSYVPPKSTDPDESWRAQTVRPITRNKLISIAAHVTVAIIYPNFFAQNDDDEEDRAAAEVMRDLVEWVIQNSPYKQRFIQAVVQMLVEPATIIEVKYQEVVKTIRKKLDNGEYKTEEAVDEVMSGFQQFVVGCAELLIPNFYENDIQRQRVLIRHKKVDYYDAEMVYGKYENWKYVLPQVQNVFDSNTQTFYQATDNDLEQNQVHEVCFYSRPLDLELTFINGVLMCDPDKPISRNDKRYPFAKSGYEPINNGNFFYYKSAANKLSSDQGVIDTLYNMVLDGTFISLMPPMANYGTEDITSSVIVPGTITNLRPDTKLEAIGPRADLRGGLLAIDAVERSITESSQDSNRQGIPGEGSRTALEVSQLERNAQVVLGLFGKMIGFLVEDIGMLIVGDILQYMTTPIIDEITSVEGRLNYRKFLLPNKIESGKKITKKIVFSDYGSEKVKTPEDAMSESFKVLNEEGGMDSQTRISRVDPKMFRMLKYKVFVEPDTMAIKSKALERALNLEAYDRMIQNPYVDGEAVTRDFLIGSFRPSDTDKYIKKGNIQPSPLSQVGLNRGTNQNMTGQITGSNSLGAVLSK